MRRFSISANDTLKTAAAGYGCCECPEICSCDPDNQDPWIRNPWGN